LGAYVTRAVLCPPVTETFFPVATRNFAELEEAPEVAFALSAASEPAAL
jgi:hypothetical protein